MNVNVSVPKELIQANELQKIGDYELSRKVYQNFFVANPEHIMRFKAYGVATGKMTRYEMSNELIRTMFTSTCALTLGSVSQAFIEVPVLGYMIGSFVGSMVGSFAYSAAYKPAISFCVDTGFTFFGLVNQDYELPADVMQEIGMDVFDYENFDYEKHEPERFEYSTFTAERFEPEKIEMTFLRRGVIGIGEIGYLSET